MLNANLSQEYKQFNDDVLDIYKSCIYFSKNYIRKRNAIYIFSKVTQNILEGDEQIKNDYGIFNSQEVLNIISDSFKMNDNVIKKLKKFIENDKI